MDDSRPSSKAFDPDGPSFGLTLVAVLAGGVISNFVSALFFGFAPFMTRTGWTVLTSLFGAYAVRFALRMLGYEIGLIAAVAAFAIGTVVDAVLRNAIIGAGPAAFPVFGVSGIVGMLLSTWIIQNMARSMDRGLL